MQIMRIIFTISKREITRLRSRFTGKSRIALLAIILLAAIVGYVVYQQDIGMSRHLYAVGVSPDAPPITDERFKTIEIDPYSGSDRLREGKLDLYVTADSIAHKTDSERSLYALGALEQYLEKHEMLRISEEYEIDQAFPLRIEVRHMKVDDEISGEESTESFADILEPEPSPLPTTDPKPEPTSPEALKPEPSPGSETPLPPEIEPPSAVKTDDAVREQLEDFKNSGGLPEFQAEFVSDKEIIVPSLSTPPVPLAQVILAFLYIIPIFMVGVFFTSSFMEEKLGRKLIVLFSAPVTPFQVIAGKMIPYICYSFISIIAVTLILGGNILLSLAIFIPVSMLIFSALLMVAMLYRTFKDQTFFSVLAAWVMIAYLVTPAMFTGLSDVSYFSPLTLAVEMYRDEPFGLKEYLLATIPLYLLFSVTVFVGIRVFNEEYIMGFRSLYRKVGEAINLVMDRDHLSFSVILVSLMFIPLVLMVQFASIVVGLNLSEIAALSIIFPVAILSEELAKSIGVVVLWQNEAIASLKDVIKFSFFAALGFFLGEKLLLYLTLSVVSKTMFIEAALGSGWLILPLAMHFVTTCVVCLLSVRLGSKYYPLAILAGSLIHGAYNLIVMRGQIF